jgi:hypothetical protein
MPVIAPIRLVSDSGGSMIRCVPRRIAQRAMIRSSHAASRMAMIANGTPSNQLAASAADSLSVRSYTHLQMSASAEHGPSDARGLAAARPTSTARVAAVTATMMADQ